MKHSSCWGCAPGEQEGGAKVGSQGLNRCSGEWARTRRVRSGGKEAKHTNSSIWRLQDSLEVGGQRRASAGL